MEIYFTPLNSTDPAMQTTLDALVRHIESRQVAIINKTEDSEEMLAQAAGLISEASDTAAREEQLALISQVIRLGKPVLRLAQRYGHPVAEVPHTRTILYSQLYVAQVGIDMFLEAHCGYRVPLGGADRMTKDETTDRY